MAEEVTSIKWHPVFCSAMELEFLKYKDLVDFNREFPLSKEPLRIDLLMIKKIKDVVLDIDIGRLFKTYNIIEYKSPKDGLTIDDYIKTVGYAYLYKGLGATVDAVPLFRAYRYHCQRYRANGAFQKDKKRRWQNRREISGRLLHHRSGCDTHTVYLNEQS